MIDVCVNTIRRTWMGLVTSMLPRGGGGSAAIDSSLSQPLAHLRLSKINCCSLLTVES